KTPRTKAPTAKTVSGICSAAVTVLELGLCVGAARRQMNHTILPAYAPEGTTATMAPAYHHAEVSSAAPSTASFVAHSAKGATPAKESNAIVAVTPTSRKRWAAPCNSLSFWVLKSVNQMPATKNNIAF